MVSVKIILILVVTMVFVSVAHTDDLIEEGKEVLEKSKEEIGKKVDDIGDESKGFFQSLGDKVKDYYGQAVEKSKEAAKATADAISKSYTNLKEKASDLIDSPNEKKN